MTNWKTTETCYEVSEDGQVRRIGSDTSLKPRVDRYGYEIVTLWVNGMPLTRKIHRLVAIAFVPTSSFELTVDHIDDDKLNNRASNLQWLTAAQNMTKGFETGAHKVGEARIAGRKVKLTNEDIPLIRQMISDGLGNSEIGHMFGVTCGCIYSIRAGKSWIHVT